ncbi:DUF6320 domain-containing protein [Faecalispora anaeroviscerum]|uniref:DUF6320 domain-containing protein n=1 Tax=Faecalispora anaeroviscerum TaxID=2991836 RepID=UPI0024B99399|nr:DUF6320 domain-containing protein [Faecalispora anaeroviscerum]
MLRCEHCKVDLPGEQKRCPLCQNKPLGTPDKSGSRFPKLPKSRQTISRILTAWIAFGSVCAAALCVIVNVIMPAGGWWSLFVIAGITSLWIDYAIMMKKRKNLPKSILWQVISVSLIALFWDLFTGFSGWSVDYVFPILCSCAMITMSIVAKVRRLDTQNYILYLMIDCILGIVCFILLLTGAVQVVIPSAVSFGASIVFLAFLLFFEGKALWAEIQRRLHI